MRRQGQRAAVTKDVKNVVAEIEVPRGIITAYKIPVMRQWSYVCFLGFLDRQPTTLAKGLAILLVTMLMHEVPVA